MVRRLGRQKKAGVVTAAASALAFAVSWQLGLVPMGLAAVVGLLTGGVVVGTARRDPGTRVGTPGSVWIEHDVLFAQNAHSHFSVPLEEAVGGWLEDAHDGPTVVVATRAGDVIAAKLAEGKQDEAWGLLSAAGIDHRAVAMTVGRTTAGTRGCASGCLLASALIAVPILALSMWALAFYGKLATYALVIAGLFVLAFVLALRALDTTRVTVGRDGVTVTRSWRSRFLPYARLDHVVLAGRELALFGTEGEVQIMCQNDAAAQALRDRIEAARGPAGDGGAGVADARMLARAGRSAAAWREHLASLLEGVSRYRARSLERADLWVVLEDAAASPELRVAAAVALSAGADADERRRMRVASDSCALRPLRIALEQASEGQLELATIEEAAAAHDAGGADPRRLNGPG